MNRRTLFQGALGVLTFGLLPRRAQEEDNMIRAGPWIRDTFYFEAPFVPTVTRIEQPSAEGWAETWRRLEAEGWKPPSRK